jgi:hypothetical protein
MTTTEIAMTLWLDRYRHRHVAFARGDEFNQ